MSDNGNGANTERNTEGLQKRLKNLRPPWQPGQRSPNPSGRPKRSLLDREIDKLLKARCPEDKQNRRFAELVAWGLVKAAVKGDVLAARLVAERSGGKVRSQDEVEPIVTINMHIHKNVPVVLQPAKVIEGK